MTIVSDGDLFGDSQPAQALLHVCMYVGRLLVVGRQLQPALIGHERMPRTDQTTVPTCMPEVHTHPRGLVGRDRGA